MNNLRIISITAHAETMTLRPFRLTVHAVALIDTGATIPQEIKSTPTHGVKGPMKEARLRVIADEKIAEVRALLKRLGFSAGEIEAVESDYSFNS